MRQLPDDGQVFLADASDSLLQGDLFRELIKDRLTISSDDRDVRVRSCPYVMDELRAYGSEPIAWRFQDDTLHWPTTIGASTDRMRAYVDAMIFMLSHQRLYPGKGSDVAAHYRVVHDTRGLDPVFLYPDDSPFGTLGYYGQGAISWDSEGRYLNGRGEPYVFVHQHDRFGIPESVRAETA